MNNPTDTGLSSTDATGVILNNDDLLESCSWIPTVIPQAPQYCLHGLEHLMGADVDLIGGEL